MKWIVTTAVIATIVGFSLIHKNSSPKKIMKSAAASNSFALLELFTSEGCSSCPAAERLLPQLTAVDSGIVPLSFHVDYWNELGWEDKFSKAEFTARQREYGEQFQLQSIYTPQLVINGEYELVGSNRSTAEKKISDALKEKPLLLIGFDEVKKEEEKLRVSLHADGELKDQNIFLALIQKHAEINVRAGENHGKTLSHINVVRSLIKKSAEQKMNFSLLFPKDLDDDNWTIVLFAQDKRNMRIGGVAVYKK